MRVSADPLPSRSSHQKRILVVEDEALIGLTLADLLTDEGFVVIGPVASRAEALAILERGVLIHAGLLDLTLDDGVCVGLACELQARGIPFVVFSGHSPGTFDLSVLRGVPWFEKPGSAEEIIAALTAQTQGRDGTFGTPRRKIAKGETFSGTLSPGQR